MNKTLAILATSTHTQQITISAGTWQGDVVRLPDGREFQVSERCPGRASRVNLSYRGLSVSADGTTISFFTV